MGVDALTFALGALLLLVGILGGGFELRELKIPTVSKPVRVVSLVAGVFLTLAGIGMHVPAEAGPKDGTEASSPKDGTDRSLSASIDPKAELIAAIRYSDDIEAEARRELDPSLLSKAFTGEALRAGVEVIRSQKSKGVYADESLEDQEILSVKMSPDESGAEVQVIETWSTVYYWLANQKCAWRMQSQRTPQTIHLQRRESGWMVSSILFDIQAPKAESVACD